MTTEGTPTPSHTVRSRCVVVVAPVLLLGTLMAGCIGDDPTCIDDATRDQAYAAVFDVFEKRGAERVSVEMEGTFEGETGRLLMVFDPEDDEGLYRMEGEFSDFGTSELKVSGEHYSIENDTMGIYARDHRPGGAYEALGFDEGAPDDDLGIDFGRDLAASDWETTCGILNGTEVVEFTYTEGSKVDRALIVEHDPPHRPIQIFLEDVSLQTDGRIFFSFDDPSVRVDDSLERAAASFFVDVREQRTNDRNGTYTAARLTDETEWIRFEEVEFNLVDEEGWVLFNETLTDGTWDMGEGNEFTYHDRDGNGIVSPGDELVADVGEGLEVILWDTWADGFAGSLSGG